MKEKKLDCQTPRRGICQMFRKFEFLNKRFLHYTLRPVFVFSFDLILWSVYTVCWPAASIPQIVCSRICRDKTSSFFTFEDLDDNDFHDHFDLDLVMTMRVVLRGQYIWDRLSVLLTNQSVVGQPCPHPLPVLLSSCHHHTIVIVIIKLSLLFSSSSYFCGIR